MALNEKQSTSTNTLGEGRLAAHDLSDAIPTLSACDGQLDSSWIPTSRSNSFLKNVHHFTVGGNLLNFPWFLPWNPKESARCPTSKPQYLAMFLPFVFNHYFSDFSNPPKTKKITGCLSKSPSLPPKNWASVFFFPVQKKAHLEHHLSDFASAPPCSAPVPLPLESKVVVAPTLRPDVGPRAGRRWGGMWTGTRGFIP